MLWGVDVVDAATENRDRPSSGFQRSFVRFTVNAKRQSAHNRYTVAGKFCGKKMRHLASVGACPAGADNADRQQINWRKAPAHKKYGWGTVGLAQWLRI